MGTILNWLLDVVVTALALWLVTVVVPGVHVLPPNQTIYADGQYDHALVFLGVAIVFLLVNAVVSPVLRTVGLPLTCLTLGLFALVINAAVFLLAGWLSQQIGLGLVIEGFWQALIGAAVLAIVRVVLDFITGPLRTRA
ncbi:phage holin family protein [Corynebacterium sp.]|uniref:phage holin family protein n=1 Tax=Corynebacterium sp. TaxID=1720 RepID=UPI003735D4B6